MNPRLVARLAAIVVFAGTSVGSGPASGTTSGAAWGTTSETRQSAVAAGTARGSLTRAEFRKVEAGMTRSKVQRIFGAGGGCAYVTYTVGEVKYVNRQYLQDNGLFTAIQYDTAKDGRMRVRDIRFAKQWNLAKLCS